MLAPRSPKPTAASIAATRVVAVAARAAEQRERQRDVLRDREVRQHVEGLEHEADVPAPQQRQRVVVERRKVLTRDRDAFRRRRGRGRR